MTLFFASFTGQPPRPSERARTFPRDSNQAQLAPAELPEVAQKQGALESAGSEDHQRKQCPLSTPWPHTRAAKPAPQPFALFRAAAGRHRGRPASSKAQSCPSVYLSEQRSLWSSPRAAREEGRLRSLRRCWPPCARAPARALDSRCWSPSGPIRVVQHPQSCPSVCLSEQLSL